MRGVRRGVRKDGVHKRRETNGLCGGVRVAGETASSLPAGLLAHNPSLLPGCRINRSFRAVCARSGSGGFGKAPIRKGVHRSVACAWVLAPYTGCGGSASLSRLRRSARMRGRASVAQGIEHRSPKAGVVRSNRTGGTIEYVQARGCVCLWPVFRFGGGSQNVPENPRRKPATPGFEYCPHGLV